MGLPCGAEHGRWTRQHTTVQGPGACLQSEFLHFLRPARGDARIAHGTSRTQGGLLESGEGGGFEVTGAKISGVEED